MSSSSPDNLFKQPRERFRKTKGKGNGLLRLLLELPFKCSENIKLVLKNVSPKNKVSQVKLRLEQELGILPEMYYLSYLDSVPMEEPSRLCDHDIVNQATLRVNVWRMWQDLLRAALSGNIKDCFACSVNIAGSSEWSKYCAWAALFVASHYGHHNLVAELLRRTSLAINFTSPCGWTALHATARMGRWKAMCMLIDNGADVRTTDNAGRTAHDLAHANGHKKCENSLSFCQWNLQKHRTEQERKLDYNAAHDRQLYTRLEYQLLDSTLKISYRGTQGQLYTAHTANPITEATVKKFHEERDSNPFAKEELQKKLEKELSCRDEHGKLDFNYGWFDELRAQQLIPPTRDIIKYSDPSSCQLRPRSILNPDGFKTRLYSPPPPPDLVVPSSPRTSALSSPLPSAATSPRTSAATSASRERRKVFKSWPIQPHFVKVGGAGAASRNLRPPEATHVI